MILAGIDEAGYGPLLGPLVVSASAFEVPGALAPDEPESFPCLWKLLRGVLAKSPQKAKTRLLIADSKIVHNLTDGGKLLERGVLTMLRCLHGQVDPGTLCAGTLLELLGCEAQGLPEHPWYAGYNPPLPYLCDPADLGITTNMVSGAMQRAGVRPVCMRSALISERVFNRLVGATQNKASALVSITLSHLYFLHTQYGHLGLVVGIDKQGGRDHYTTLLLQAFPEAQLRVLEETGESSVYLLTENTPAGLRRTLLSFREKGESRAMPTALASMICKYLRELFMHGFNAWWCQQIPQLRPTAGYYGDGTRWLLEVEPHLPRLGIQREHLVRCR